MMRAAIRSLLRAKGFTVLVLLILGIGIGATTAIFSAVNEVMLRPLSFREPKKLVMLWESNEERGWNQVHVAPGNALSWRERVRAFEDVAVVGEAVRSLTLTTGKASVQVLSAQVSGNAFTLLGARPFLGRLFTFEESWVDAPPLILLGHAAWMKHFGGDSSVAGRTVRLDGVAFQVVGVLPAAFRYAVNDAEVWTTFRWSGTTRSSQWFRRAHVARAIARLKPGVTPDQASRELAAVALQLEGEFPETNRGMKAGVTPLHTFLVGDRGLSLLLLLGAVGVLQLLVVANVGNLLEARWLVRRHELAVRTALGAGRGQVVRQVLMESLVLALGGAILGFAIGFLGLGLIAGFRPDNLPDLVFRLDWRVAAFTVGVAGVSALLFGLHPALASSRVDVTRHLREDGRTAGSADRRRRLTAHSLIAAEIALAVMLVSGAGLMVRSIGELRRVESGVNMDRVLTFELRPPSGVYPTDSARTELVARLLERLQEVPGVLHVGAGRLLPFMGLGWTGDFTLEGWGPEQFGVGVRHREATAGYFRALGIPVREGALVADRLPPGAPLPVVVNQAFVDRYAAGQSAVGRRIAFDRTADSTTVWYSIVAVVGNERMQLTAPAEPEIIGHLATDTPGLLRFVVKGRASPSALVEPVRGAVASVDPEVPILRPRSMEAVALDALAADRYLMILLGAFAAVAMILAAVGVYGVASQVSRSRIREVGIRIALGASKVEVTRALMARILLFVAVGAGAGVLGVLAVGQVLRKLLFRIEPSDPLTLAVVVLLQGAVAIGATLQPAARAARTDPARIMSSP
ncbi:MAG: ABC transporter permease [Gemmatimonadales bacterium]|nr:ABC transporter permease [Gemmatimonadales bacterium]